MEPNPLPVVLSNREALLITVLMVISIYLNEHRHPVQSTFLMTIVLGIMIVAVSSFYHRRFKD